jgi:hypothetical protein
MLNLAAIGIVVVSLVSAVPAPPPPDRVRIEVVKVNGSGCRPRTAAAAISPDGEAFTVTYSEYLAQVGVGAKPNDYRKDCRLTLRLDIPPGFTYTIESVDYRGFAQLERGASGVQRASYHFQTQPKPSPVDHPFAGPFDDGWQTTDHTRPGDQSWAPCGQSRKLMIDTELEVNAGTSDPRTTTSLLVMDSTDGSVASTYHFVWRRC